MLPALMAAITTVGFLALLGTVLRADDGWREASAETEAASVAGDVAVQLAGWFASSDRGLENLEASVTSPTSFRVSPVEGLRAVSAIAEPDRPRVAVGDLADDIVADEALRAALARARDTGALQLSPPVGRDAVPVLVAPMFRTSDGAPLVPAPRSTQARRETIVGFLAGVVDVDAALADAGDGRVAVFDGTTRLGGSREFGSDTASSLEVELGARTWVVAAEASPVGGLTDWTVAILAVVVVGTILVLTVFALEVRGRMAAENALAKERQRSSVIDDLMPILQRSMHLSDVLPTLAVQLRDRFGLAGVSISSGEPGGGFQELFCLGQRPSTVAAVHAGLARPLDEGTTALLALSRGGRMVAELRFVTGRDLTESEMHAIHESAELVTSALVMAKAMERQQVAMDQLSELDSLKTVFLTTAAHELKTPLAAMLGLAQILDTHWHSLTEDERRSMSQRVAANAHALDLLVRDLLDFSKLETGDLAVDPRPIDLGAEVTTVVDRQRAAWDSNEIVLDVEDGPPVVADSLAVERVLTNLVANAVKYSPEGSTVVVSVQHVGRAGELIVDDEGPGIEVSERDRVFERFYRGSSDEVVRTRGVGIGLSVVREFVRKLGGTIDVEDSPAGGARLRCRFPHVVAGSVRSSLAEGNEGS
ncbi:ATP-binding protein [Actinospongicola halichondriae]|uniref:sensor histidine kinase n=1 Tax=Actinospongicola halichondriae TaxID=3236844 RepID=UPI003D542118